MSQILDIDQEKVYEIKLPVCDEGYAELMLQGDDHFGNPHFSQSYKQRYINILKDHPHMQTILMGDYFEASDFTAEYRMISTNKKRFKEQIAEMVQYYEPVNKQIRAALRGNHDERVLRKRYVQEVLDALDIENYLEYVLHKWLNKDIIVGTPEEGLLLFLKVGKQTYTLYVIHGRTSARYRPFIQVEHILNTSNADIVAHGHNHVLDMRLYRKFVPDIVDNQPVRKIVEQLGVLTGCFLRYGGYVEAKSYPLNRMGAPILRLYKDTKFVQPIFPHQIMGLHKYFTHAYGLTPLPPRQTITLPEPQRVKTKLGKEYEQL